MTAWPWWRWACLLAFIGMLPYLAQQAVNVWLLVVEATARAWKRGQS